MSHQKRASNRRLPLRRMTPYLSALGVAIAASVAGTAVAGNVKGRVAGHEKLVPDVYAEAAKPDAHRFTWREPSPTVRGEFRAQSANISRELCIAAMSSGNAQPHEPILVKITGGRTIPTTLAVSPGTRLSFDNRDPFPHRLYFVGQKTWGPETINPGAHRDWSAPPGQGRFEIRDELFPSVRSYVVVDPQVVDIAYPSRDGAFAINLPPGEFVLKAFFAGKQVGRAISVVSKERQLVEIRDPLNLAEGADGSK